MGCLHSSPSSSRKQLVTTCGFRELLASCFLLPGGCKLRSGGFSDLGEGRVGQEGVGVMPGPKESGSGGLSREKPAWLRQV